MRGHECFKNLNCKLFMRSVNIRHVVSVGRGLYHPRSELQQVEIVFSRASLLQNLSTFSVEYVCTAAVVTKHKNLQQQLYLSKILKHVVRMKQRCESSFSRDVRGFESFSR